MTLLKCFLLLACLCYESPARRMGPMPGCDDGKSSLSVDWDTDSTSEYICTQDRFSGDQLFTEECQDQPVKPIHVCMDESLSYTDIPPRSGRHRPVWPAYGEYRYVPPQRWLHNLEHGAAVFLYHPCAQVEQIEKFRETAKGCLRRHIITPYKMLSKKQPFAVMTWACRLLLGNVNITKMVDYIKRRALRGPENKPEDGLYNTSLLQPATSVSDDADTKLCPKRSVIL